MQSLAGASERAGHFIEGCVSLIFRLADHPLFSVVLEFMESGFRRIDVILLVLPV
jgi:hypothetical protein